MPLPGNVVTITVTGTYVGMQGLAQSGTVVFTPNASPLTDVTAPDFVVGNPSTATLDVNGAFSIVLPCTDNTVLSPQGWIYSVTENLTGGTRTYLIALPSSLGASVNLADVAPLSVVPQQQSLLYGVLATANTWLGKNTFSGEVVVPTPVNAGDAATKAYVDAISTVGVQLGGDIGGTNSVPLVTSTHLSAGLPVNQGGTGATNTTAARTNLGLGTSSTYNVNTTAGTITALGTQAAGASGQVADAAHVHPMPALDQLNAPTSAVSFGSQRITNLANGASASDAATVGQLPTALPPNGSAGGDLSGSFPNPTVSKITGIAVSGTPTTGFVLTATSSSTANWQAPGSAPVFSVFGRTGTITAQSGDYTAAQVGAQAVLVPTGVKTSNYGASPADFVPVDTTSGAVTVTLPNAPADKTVIGVKMVVQGGTNAVTVAAAGSDVFNKTGGSTSLTLSLLNQGVLLQYKASGAIWYVLVDDLTLSSLDSRYVLQSSLPLAIASGGTGQTTASASFNALSPNTTLGDITYANGAGTNTRLAGNTAASKKFLTQTGSGTASAAPVWASIVSGDVPGFDGVTVTGTPTSGQVPTATSGTTATWQTPSSSGGGPAWFNVKSYGAVGNASADDTTAIQAAINAAHAASPAGGIVYFPPGNYKITANLTLYSHITLLGDGVQVSQISQVTNNADGLVGIDLSFVTIKGLWIEGTTSGTGIGIHFTLSSNPATTYLNFEDLTVGDFGGDGINIANAIVSVMTRVNVQTCGGDGFSIHGIVSGAAGTSTAFIACYANANVGHGFHIYNMTGCQMVACAGDNQTTAGKAAVFLDLCVGSVVGGDYEVNAIGIKVNGGLGNTINGYFNYGQPSGGVGIYATGSTTDLILQSVVEEGASGSATAWIKTDSGSFVTILSSNHTTANSFSGTNRLLVLDSTLTFQKASTATATLDNFGGSLVSNCNIVVPVGGTFRVPTGSNATQGTVVANGTTAVTVSTTAASTTANVYFSLNTPGGTPGVPYVFSTTAGTSFQVKSSAGDTSTWNWIMFGTT